jgi:predicted O-methyltransferase YrrM
MDLSTFLMALSIPINEGSCVNCEEQYTDLKRLVQNKKRVLEIGFNAGHSSELFLRSNPDCHVTAFDLNEHESVRVSKYYLDLVYVNRHRLYLGDSRISLPAFLKESPEPFDLIFIDGGHDLDIAQSDLFYCSKLAHKDTIVIMDDVVYQDEFEKEWTIGPSQAWKEAIESGLIMESDHKEYRIGHGMAWGTFTHFSKLEHL